MIKIIKNIFSCIFLLIFIQVVLAEKISNKKKFVGYPITESDSLYIQNIREDFSNITNKHPEFHSYNIIAYHDQQAGVVNLLSDRYLEIKLDVLPIPYIGKYLKGLLSINEYARFYNVWEDSLHIQEEKRGTYIYKIRPDSSFQLLKYYGNRKRRKHRERRIYKGNDIISLLNSKLNGSLLNEIQTFAFAFPYFGVVDDHGDSVSLDPNKFFVVEKKGNIPIMDDKNVPIKDLYITFDENGNFLQGGGLIKRGFDTRVIIKELIE